MSATAHRGVDEARWSSGEPSVSLAREFGRVRNRLRTTWRMPTSCIGVLWVVSLRHERMADRRQGTHDTERVEDQAEAEQNLGLPHIRLAR